MLLAVDYGTRLIDVGRITGRIWHSPTNNTDYIAFLFDPRRAAPCVPRVGIGALPAWQMVWWIVP